MNINKILVTGISGFVGKHLARELVSRRCQVYGVGLSDSPSDEVKKLMSGYYRCDLTDEAEVAGLPLGEFDTIVNLAGLAKVGDSFKDPDMYNRINVDVLAVLGRRMVKEKNQARVIAISTGSVYEPTQKMPLTEDSQIAMDGSPYSLSKLKMEKAASDLRDVGLDCIIVRPFNHIGPGQESGFLVPDLVSKIDAALERSGVIKVGNLETKRDYTDVRDVVKAYAELCLHEHLPHDTYNVCTGKSVAGNYILERLLDLIGAKDNLKIEVDESLIRPRDPKDLYGSFERLKQDTGWKPTISLEQTLKDTVEDCKSRRA